MTQHHDNDDNNRRNEHSVQIVLSSLKLFTSRRSQLNQVSNGQSSPIIEQTIFIFFGLSFPPLTFFLFTGRKIQTFQHYPYIYHIAQGTFSFNQNLFIEWPILLRNGSSIFFIFTPQTSSFLTPTSNPSHLDNNNIFQEAIIQPSSSITTRISGYKYSVE